MGLLDFLKQLKPQVQQSVNKIDQANTAVPNNFFTQNTNPYKWAANKMATSNSLYGNIVNEVGKSLSENVAKTPMADFGQTLGTAAFPLTKEYKTLQDQQLNTPENLANISPSFQKTPANVAGEAAATMAFLNTLLGLGGLYSKTAPIHGGTAWGPNTPKKPNISYDIPKNTYPRYTLPTTNYIVR